MSLNATLQRHAALLLYVSLLLSWCGRAVAQESRYVAPGERVVIATSTMPITNEGGQLQGTVSITQSGTPTKYDLIYTTPTGVSQWSDTLKYKDDGAEHTQVIAGGPIPPTPGSAVYQDSFKILFVLFVLAVLLEQGLAVLFNWRAFLVVFDSKSVKTIISLAFAWFFVSQYQLGATTKLVNLYSSANYPCQLGDQS